MTPDDVLRPTLLRQHGVLTRAQALAAGLSPDAVDRRLAARRWHPVHPRVYRDGAFGDTAAARVHAAVLWAGTGAALSGHAAAWWHGLVTEPPPVVGVTVPRRRYPRPRDGVAVRRRRLAAADVRVLGGVPVVAAPVAALEAAVERGSGGPEFLEELLVNGAVGVRALRRAHARGAGTHGAATAGRMLAVAAGGALVRARYRLAVLLGAGGSSGWVGDGRAVGAGPGLAHPPSRVVVVVTLASPLPDGEPPAAGEPRRHGWAVVEVEPCDVFTRPAGVLARIRSAVRPGAAVGVAS